MRAVAIIINLIQMFIILGLFFSVGLSLGGWTILALFVLLLIAFVNLLVLLFHSALSAADQTHKTGEKIGLVKRQDLRVLYAAGSRPDLEVGERRFPILDLSENGIRISIDRQKQLRKRFRGRLTLLSQKVLTLKLTLLRRQGDEAALLIKNPIDYAVLLAEKELTGR